MPGYDDPNRPEWTGKRKAKNFARINAACKGLKTSGGKPPTECPKWRDGKVDGGKCSYNGDCRKAVCNCSSCPDRYGYCGG